MPSQLTPQEKTALDEMYRQGSYLQQTGKLPTLDGVGDIYTRITPEEEGGHTPRAVYQTLLSKLQQTGIAPYAQEYNIPFRADTIASSDPRSGYKAPVTLIASNSGKETTKKNIQQLTALESALVSASATSVQDLQNKLAQGYTLGERGLVAPAMTQGGGVQTSAQYGMAQRAAGELGISLPPFQGVGASPATHTMTQQANLAAQQKLGNPQTEAQLRQIELEAQSALAQARSALTTQNPAGLDTALRLYEQHSARYESQLKTYLDDATKLREDRAKLMNPTTRETELRRQLTDIQNQAKQFELQTQKDKLSEFEGQTMSFATGRASELDFKASFAHQEMALKQQNLLAELGLEQDLREFKMKTVQQQLDDFASNFELRSSVEDKIMQMEEGVLEYATTLRGEQQKVLSSIFDSLEGVAWGELPQTAQAQLNNLALASSVPIELIKEGLRAQKGRYLLEQATALQDSPQQAGMGDGLLAVGGLLGGFSSVKAQAAFNSQLASLRGNDKSIAEKIIGQALANISDADTRKRVTGGFKISQELTRLESLLREYESQGGDTGFFKGNIQKLYQKVGQTGTPELANLATQTLNVLDILARSRTGAVITTNEEKLYNRILPSIDKVGELNYAVISGLKDSLIADVDSSLRFALTEQGLTQIKSALPDVFSEQPIGAVDSEQIFEDVENDTGYWGNLWNSILGE